MLWVRNEHEFYYRLSPLSPRTSLEASIILFSDAWSNSPTPSIGMQSTYKLYRTRASVFFLSLKASATRRVNTLGSSPLNISLTR